MKRLAPVFFAILVLAGASVLRAQATRIYIANDDHTDFMWTADAETYNAAFVDMLDHYLRLADETATNATPYQSRFNADGSYWLWQYERRKSPVEFERLIARVRDGHISAPMTTLVSCYGGQPVEAVLRGMYYAGRLERRYGLRFPLAVAMENQTLPLGLSSLWAGSGAKYSWRGVCACASKLPTSVLQQRPHEIYWYTGHDGQRVLMKWHSLAGENNRHIGGYAEAHDPEASINYLDSNAAFLRRYTDASITGPYRVRGAFGFGWDALDRKTGQPYAANPKDYPQTEHFHIIAQAQTTTGRQVIVSNEQDFFVDFEKAYGANLPSESVTYGNEWELYSASMAETSARVKRSVEKLRAAELMAVLVSLQRPALLEGREAARDLAFTDLGLFWEHDWTADGPVSRESRAAWQELLAGEIESYVDTLHTDAAAQLGALIRKPDANAQRFFVLNPLGWTRTDYADIAYSGSKNVHVRDVATGRDVPHQFVRLGDAECLRVLASDVPSAGYKTFELLDGPGTAPTNAAAVVGADKTTLENAHVKLVIDPDGAIASFIDKANPNSELAQTIGGLKLNDFAANDTNGSAIVVENSGPVSVTLKCVSGAGRQHTTRITLVRDSDRVEIRNEITENFADVRHWAFSFNLPSPDIHTEEIGAIIRDKTKADGGDYADTHARFDYVTLNHFADITDGANTRGVTLANSDCAFAKLGQSTVWALDTALAQINVLAGGQVDGTSLGIPAQNGATNLLQRFGLRAHGAYDQVAAMKFGLEQQNPFVTGSITGNETSPLPATNFSALILSNPDVLLWALKPAEEGIASGLIARVWNVGSAPAEFTLAPNLPGQALATARQITHIETDIKPMTINDGAMAGSLAPQQLKTFRLEFR